MVFFELVVGGLELGHSLGKVLKVGESFLEEFFKERKMWEELLLILREFLGIEGVDPLVERGKVVGVGVDGFELLLSGSLTEEVKCSFTVGEGVCLVDRSGFGDYRGCVCG